MQSDKDEKPITVVSLPTAALDEAQRQAVMGVCVAAHEDEEFWRLFAYIPQGGLHFLGYEGDRLVSPAVATTPRWRVVW